VDLAKYLNLFLSESQEHLQKMDDLLLQLERSPEDGQAIDAMFREAHSIKGMSATMGFEEIRKIAHALEDFLDPFRKGLRSLDRQAIDLLLQSVDLLRTSLTRVAAGEGGEPPRDTRKKPAPAPAPPVRREGMLRVAPELLDDLVDLTSELLIAQGALENGGPKDPSTLDEQVSKLHSLVRALSHQAMRLRMVPFEVVVERFPRMVRDLAREAGKEVNFEIHGKELEMDRALLEALVDPLVHILRNAVDHGIEGPEERGKSGKPREGTIRLEAWKEKDTVLVRVVDDGRGIDLEKVRRTAVKRGLLSEEKASALSDTEALHLITLPGFSTADQVTEVSGRGVGMDVVSSAVKSLQGSFQIESQLGKGTTITTKLPLTLLLLPVLLIEVADETYALALNQVRAILDCPAQEGESLGPRQFLRRGDKQIPLIPLRTLLGLPDSSPLSSALLVEAQGEEVGVVVDKVLGSQEVVAKSLRSPLARWRGLAGVTILGEAEVVLILDLQTLLPSSARLTGNVPEAFHDAC
jgi:two-component system chemotaxis sensor kinase CheA